MMHAYEGLIRYALIAIKGFSVHPGDGKNKIINVSNVVIAFHPALPATKRPEHSALRGGFYHLLDMCDDAHHAKLEYILHSHDAEKLAYKKETMQHAAARPTELYGDDTVTVHLKDNGRNMIEKIKPLFHSAETARLAIQMTGLTPVAVPVRGGIDGSTLNWMALPCPNLTTGSFHSHENAECITAEHMDKSVGILINIATLYAQLPSLMNSSFFKQARNLSISGLFGRDKQNRAATGARPRRLR